MLPFSKGPVLSSSFFLYGGDFQFRPLIKELVFSIFTDSSCLFTGILHNEALSSGELKPTLEIFG